MEAYLAMFVAEATFEAGVEAVVAAMLQSPYFLYRREIGDVDPGTGLARLTSHEVASELSYLLTDSMPDDLLFRAVGRWAA